jgi:hypothetical protein
MNKIYLFARSRPFPGVYLLMLLLSVLAPAALRAQSITLQPAPNNTLPLKDFGTVPVGRTSALQTFLVSGTGLSGNITVTAPAGFEIRTGTAAFSTQAVDLPSSAGNVGPVAIDVRFAPVANTGSYAGDVQVSNPGATTQRVAVTGTAPAGPYVFVDPTTLPFGAVSQTGSGQTKTFVVGGDNLVTLLTLTTALTGGTASGAIQVRNPAVSNSAFATSLTIAPVNGKVPATTIEARIVGPIPSQSNFTGTITATSGTAIAAPDNVVQVTGNNPFTGTNTSSTFTVSTSGGQPLMPFSTVPEKASANQTLIVSGSFLVNGITVRAPNNFQVSLDAAFGGLGNGTPGSTTTSNTITIPAMNGTVNNTTVYVRYVPLVAGTESGTGVTFDSEPATSRAAIVQANSIGSIESRTIYTKPAPLVIGSSVQSTSQLIRIHAELVRNPVRISVSGESMGALGNPDGYAQFRISTDGVTYTDPAVPGSSYIELNPDPMTNIIDRDIYVIYAPNRVGAAQAVLQYLTPDVTAAPANTVTPIVSMFSSTDANKLRGTAIDVEPTRDTPFTSTRSKGDASASIAFTPDAALSGYGEFHLVLISTSATLSVPDVMPSDGTDYNSSGGTFQGSGQSTLQDSQGRVYYVVFTGGAPAATVTGLNSNTNYYAYVFDYNSTNPGASTFINNAENYKGPAQSLVIGALLEGNAPLPVQLREFTARAEGPAAVRLAWATATELNNAGFTLERSTDGRGFANVGTVDGAGTSNTAHSYTFLDGKLPAGANLLYYRLRQTDTNGTAAYSPVRTVALNGAANAAQLQVYPNPAHGTVWARVLGPAPTAPLQLFDSVGRLVRTQSASATDNETLVSLTGLPAGLYVLRCGPLSQRLKVD